MANGACCGGAPQPKRNAGGCQCGAAGNETARDGSCGCGAERTPRRERWMAGEAATPAGAVLLVATKLTFADRLGSWKCRWSIGRMDYAVEPGLYGVGDPGRDSPVLVTANYKMTFDRLRMELSGLDAWILALDTFGVNVWCAAGKGTFGTDELVRRIDETSLALVVAHRTVVVPQLGATGVSAYEVARRSRFRVVFGPVRASDIKAYLAAGMKADEEMRTVRFTLWDRLVLAPMEVVGALKPSFILFGALFILNAVGFGRYGWEDLVAWAGAMLAGCVLTPALLPWIPGRAFAFKGFLLGLLWTAGAILWFYFPPMPLYGWLKAIAWLLVLPSFSAYAAMNFTGSSTYTSLSGVDREMKLALPPMILATALGVILLLVNDFIVLFS